MTAGKFVVALVTCLAFGAAAGAAQPAAAQDAIPIAVATQDVTPFCLIIGMLRNKAFPRFRDKYKLAFEPVQLQVDQVPVALSNNDLPMGECSGISIALNAWNKGAKNLFIFGFSAVKPVYQLISRPTIKTLDDLRGKTIGTPGIQSSSTEAIEMILKRGAGMEAQRDYALVASGVGSARVAALMTGRMDAIPMYPPDTFALAKQGYSVLAEMATYVPEYAGGANVASREFAEKNHDLFIRILEAMIETGEWVKDPANKGETIAWLAANVTVAGHALGEDDAAKLYDFYVAQDRLAFDGYAPESAVRTNVEILKERGFIKDEEIPPLGQIVDYSYLNQALRELGRPTVPEFAVR